MLEVGKRYYYITHIYNHYVGECVDVTPFGGKFKNVVKVHSCQRNWTLFFKDGFKKDTNYDVMPDGHEAHNLIDSFPWGHDIPRTKPQKD